MRKGRKRLQAAMVQLSTLLLMLALCRCIAEPLSPISPAQTQPPQELVLDMELEPYTYLHEPSARERILIYDQNGSWSNKRLSGDATMMSSGCGIYAVAHAIQWASGEARTSNNGGALLDELIRVRNDPWNVHLEECYMRVIARHGVRTYGIGGSRAAVLGVFARGGAIRTHIPGHYQVAVGAALGKDDSLWIHIVDSSIASTLEGLDSSRVYAFDSGESAKSWLKRDYSGGEYWLSWNTFSKYLFYADDLYAYVYDGSMDADVPAQELRFRDVDYPASYRISPRYGWNVQGGVLESDRELLSIRSQILSNSGEVISDATQPLSGYRFSLYNLERASGADNGVRFSRIAEPGNYVWILTGEDSAGQTITLSMYFTAKRDGQTETATMLRSTFPKLRTPPALPVIEGYKSKRTVSVDLKDHPQGLTFRWAAEGAVRYSYKAILLAQPPTGSEDEDERATRLLASASGADKTTLTIPRSNLDAGSYLKLTVCALDELGKEYREWIGIKLKDSTA